jgi:hypothetical protein
MLVWAEHLTEPAAQPLYAVVPATLVFSPRACNSPLPEVRGARKDEGREKGPDVWLYRERVSVACPM